MSFHNVYFDSPFDTLSMEDLNLCRPSGEAIGKNRNKRTVPTAVQHGFHDILMIGTEHAAIVMHHHPGCPLNELVDDPGAQLPETRISPVDTHRADDIVAFPGFLYEKRDRLRRILQVPIEGDHNIASRTGEARQDGTMLAVVAVKENADHLVPIMLCRFTDQLRRTVTAPVVDKDELKRKAEAVAGLKTTPDEFSQVLFLVEDRESRPRS